MWTPSYTRSYIPAMSDKYQGFVRTPIGKLLVKNLGLPDPTPLRALRGGRPARRRHRGPRRHRPARRVAARAARPARHRVDDRTRPGAEVRGPGLRRHRPDRRRPARRAPRLVHPAAAQPRDLPADRRPRHPAGADDGLRAGRPARPRGLHPLARQGGRPRRHGPAGLRRREGRGGRRLDAGLPALAEVGVRLGPGRPGRHPHPGRRPRSTTGCARWPARSRW